MQYKLENVEQYLWGYCIEINNRLLQCIRKLAFRSFGSIDIPQSPVRLTGSYP
jgi:hypothetical protein